MIFGKSVVVSADDAFSYFKGQSNRYGMEFCEGLCKREVMPSDNSVSARPLSGDVTYGRAGGDSEAEDNSLSVISQSGDVTFGAKPTSVTDEKPYKLGPDDMY